MKNLYIITIFLLVSTFFSCEKELQLETPKYVVITIDDMPEAPERSEKMLNILAKHNVQATIFCITQSLRTDSYLANRIAKEHILANHSLTHPHFPLLFKDYKAYPNKLDEVLYNEIDLSKHIFDSINLINNRPINNHFRYPFGDRNEETDIPVLKSNQSITYWDIDVTDWNIEIENRTGEYVLQHTKNRINHYDIPIILFHPSEDNIKGLDLVLTYLKENNIQIISLDKRKELLYE